MRDSPQLFRVLQVLSNTDGRTGRDIIDATGLKGGTVYPILHRILEEKLTTVKLESGDPVALGRPLRKFYTLTKTGRARCAEICVILTA